ENWRLAQFFKRLCDLTKIVLPKRTGSELVCVHAGDRAQHSLQEGFLRHFKREYGDGFRVLDGNVLGNVHCERRLAHGWTASDDDQVRFLESTGLFIEIGIMRF